MDVKDGDHATGRIVNSYEHFEGTAKAVCGAGTVGCALPLGQGMYDIHYEPSKDDWIWLHERCHALYRNIRHTKEYNISRGLP